MRELLVVGPFPWSGLQMAPADWPDCCVTEAAGEAAAIRIGAGFDPDKVVDVHAVRSSRAVVYYFKDPGPGFNTVAPGSVATAGDPMGHMAEREARGLRPGGFGLLLTKGLVDEVIYSERGNEVILVKYTD